MLENTKKFILFITVLLSVLLLCSCSSEKLQATSYKLQGDGGNEELQVDEGYEPTSTLQPPTSSPSPTPEPTPPLPVDESGNFTVYGCTFNINDTYVDLNGVEVTDNGEAIASMLPFMPNVETLDMDSCGVDDEHMAAIRDANPSVNVVWRIWFGTGGNYSVRTDVEMILASNSGGDVTPGGYITREDCKRLCYCTKVRFLDIGHTESLPSIEFVQYMPDLEVAILSMATWCDASPLAYCTKLEYAELCTTGINDLTPLASCTSLKHLNICNCFALRDLSPIYDLDLTRLWIGMYTPIPEEQAAEYAALHPDCKVNTDSPDPTMNGWRTYWDSELGMDVYDPRYELLRQQFGYAGVSGSPYSYYTNDPLYKGIKR